MMPRKARQQSETNLYHVMLRGNAQQQIFHDAEDNEQFIAMLEHCKRVSGFAVYAYCLMGNHVHLLMRVDAQGEPLGQIFRRFGAQYVYWYNGKYQRVGHLFQGRYRSEVVDNDAAMLTVLRYIHKNPVKAGLVQDPGEYPYSSYRAYLGDSRDVLADVGFIQGMMDREAFIHFHRADDQIPVMDIRPIRKRMSDAQALRLIQRLTGCETAADFQRLGKAQRHEALTQLKKKGVGHRQLSRLTGESRGIVQRA